MGISSSCPFSEPNDVEAGVESVIVRSISFGYGEGETPTRTVSFGCQDLEPMIMTSLGSGKMKVERSVSFKGSELEKLMSIKSSLLDEENDTSKDLTDCANDSETTGQLSLSSDNCAEAIPRSPVFNSSNPKHLAALKLQKVYKSFRTRRKLADCAVLVEQSWWKLLDFAELKRSSVSFFGTEKHETAISRWSRARTRAAKVGKGLSKNGKARKLALQHWLEAIDPRHRYGHNLHFYYVNWLHSKSREPFFYWLDIGEGKEVNLERCSRSKLQLQCIKYLGPIERLTYEVVVENGLLLYKQTGELLSSTDDAKCIFVLSTSKNLYVGKKQKGRFQHSSFLAGGVTVAAGRLIVESGVLKAVWPHSGHYKPTEENFKDFISFLRENNVDLTDVKTSSLDEEEGTERSSKHFRCNSSDEDLIQTFKDLGTEEVLVEDSTLENVDLVTEQASTTLRQQKSRQSHYFGRNLSNLVIAKRDELEFENLNIGPFGDDTAAESAVSDDYESAKEGFGTEQLSVVPKQILFDEQEDNGVGKTNKIGVLQRINSNPRMKSYQLGRQLSCKWTTGAGPRIGCVTNSPTELKFRALEQVNLSPRSGCDSRRSSFLSHKISASSSFGNEGSPVLAIDDLPQGSATHFISLSLQT